MNIIFICHLLVTESDLRVVTTGDIIVDPPTRLHNIPLSVTMCSVTLLTLPLFFLQGSSAQISTDCVQHCSVLSPQILIFVVAVFCVTPMTHTVELHLP